MTSTCMSTASFRCRTVSTSTEARPPELHGCPNQMPRSHQRLGLTTRSIHGSTRTTGSRGRPRERAQVAHSGASSVCGSCSGGIATHQCMLTTCSPPVLAGEVRNGDAVASSGDGLLAEGALPAHAQPVPEAVLVVVVPARHDTQGVPHLKVALADAAERLRAQGLPGLHRLRRQGSHLLGAGAEQVVQVAHEEATVGIHVHHMAIQHDGLAVVVEEDAVDRPARLRRRRLLARQRRMQLPSEAHHRAEPNAPPTLPRWLRKLPLPP
mmetsp:Transcript_62218/g.124687  ORF Transcript_62218/g.124687 Transcript_62218/m.124687 type:complete len:267 (+) Transcript_62218:97-897(+)